MIRIERPPMPPEVLQDAGMRKRREHCEAYDRRSDDYHMGTKKFDFGERLYKQASVKRTLFQAQHNKCCYCESKFENAADPEVDHFRPKGAVQQQQGKNREYPGYYWLAYSWSNLLVSCPKCNRSKGSLFPLSNPERRARCHHDDVDLENPLFVDPAREDPREHIRFRGPAVIGCTDKGRKTILGLELRRSGLEEKRRDRLEELKTWRFILELGGEREWDEVESARRNLEAAVRSEAEYSAMARDFLEPTGDRATGDERAESSPDHT